MTRRRALALAVVLLALALPGSRIEVNAQTAPPPASHGGPSTNPQGWGYWLVRADGTVWAFGMSSYGTSVVSHPNRPMVGAASGREGEGFWVAASDGGIFTSGYAGFFGSTGAKPLNRPVVGMAATPSSQGYWLVASDGGVFSFGDASFHGSTGDKRLNAPVVGMAATPDGGGYWLVGADGGVFSFGDAGFFGSAGALHLNRPVVGMTPTPDGGGYWLAGSDGGVFSYGDAPYVGGLAGWQNPPTDVVAIAAAKPVVPANITAPFSDPTVLSDPADHSGTQGTSFTFKVTNFAGSAVPTGTVDFTLSGMPHGSLESTRSSGSWGSYTAVLHDTDSQDQGRITATVEGTQISTTTGLITISPGNPVQLLFAQQPVAAQAGQTMAPVEVGAYDRWGNIVSWVDVTLALASNPSAATLSGTLSQNNYTNQPADFIDLSIDKAGQGYTLIASAANLPSITSQPFDVS